MKQIYNAMIRLPDGGIITGVATVKQLTYGLLEVCFVDEEKIFYTHANNVVLWGRKGAKPS